MPSYIPTPQNQEVFFQRIQTIRNHLCRLKQRNLKGKTMSQKSFGFGLKAFKRFPELIPLTLFVGGATAWAVTFIIYSLRTKPDVRLVGKNIEMPYELVKPTESRKLLTLNQKYEEITELEKLRKEIGSFKS